MLPLRPCSYVMRGRSIMIFLTNYDVEWHEYAMPHSVCMEELDDIGDPLTELRGYIRRKLEMARDFPRESRLFANEILQGAPRIMPMLEGELKALVDEKAAVIKGWMRAGKVARTDPYHLIFSIWAGSGLRRLEW